MSRLLTSSTAIGCNVNPANERTGKGVSESWGVLGEGARVGEGSHSTVVCVSSLILAVPHTRIRFIFPLAFATEGNTSRSLLLLRIRVNVNIDDVLTFE